MRQGREVEGDKRLSREREKEDVFSWVRDEGKRKGRQTTKGEGREAPSPLLNTL